MGKPSGFSSGSSSRVCPFNEKKKDKKHLTFVTYKILSGFYFYIWTVLLLYLVSFTFIFEQFYFYIWSVLLLYLNSFTFISEQFYFYIWSVFRTILRVLVNLYFIFKLIFFLELYSKYIFSVNTNISFRLLFWIKRWFN